MAGNKVNTKTKGKDDKSKTNKNANQTNDDVEDIDFALLRKPIHTSITGFAQARKIFDLATEELKELLTNECDLLYECKVCRNIFRSLANFLSHKRVYCKEKFNSACHAQFLKSTSMLSEMLKINQMEDGYQESLKESENLESENEDTRIPITKDLTTMVEKITTSKGVNISSTEEQKISFQTIPTSSVAVFQNVEYNNDTEGGDTMRAQVTELDKILTQQKAFLRNDGKFEIQSDTEMAESAVIDDNVIQISDDEDFENYSTDLKCKICRQQFATQKTLKFHMKYKHLESRLVYPCPDCLEIFATSWSVYRHLFKVHRKTSAQIRRLRDSIQSKAFRKNNPPAFYERRKNNMKTSTVQKISEEERLDQENQAWMDNMECDGELPRCGGCGRTFERRAALAAHTHTCQPRSRALARRPPETKKIEIQIRKDYNKGPPSKLILPMKMDTNENKFSVDDIQIPIKPQKQIEKPTETEKKQLDEMVMEVDDYEITNDTGESSEKKPGESYKPVMKLPFAQQAEKSNTIALKQKILSDIDIGKLLCKKCEYQSNNLQGLYDHMAGHYKWVRYSCKLCNYKHYNFDNIQAHIKIVHKLRGDNDFYYSTIKAINGTEALELSESNEDSIDLVESPESRQASRCSSDSGRMSDDSSTSSTRIEGSRRRKLYPIRSHTQRKKECLSIGDGEDSKDGDMSMDNEVIVLGDYESCSTTKTFEENSSDMDDLEEKFPKKNHTEDTSSVASRRPVRKKTKPKHEDFEYDLSNLLKMEAQGYRDSQLIASSKVAQNKKKNQQELQSNYENVNKDFCGALITLSKRAVENAAAHLKTSNGALYGTQKDPRSSNIFVRPMLPKSIPRLEKISPKKDNNDDLKDIKSPVNDETKYEEIVIDDLMIDKDENEKDNDDKDVQNTDKDSVSNTNCGSDQNNINGASSDKIKSNLAIPAVVPFKFRRQSVEVIKSPIINKNITDFTKAGMKTKILVIKPINRNKDGIQSVNAPLKFQTIKLKDPNKASNDTKLSDQVVVVKVPKVDTVVKSSNPETTLVMNRKVVPLVIATRSDDDTVTGNSCNTENIDCTSEIVTEALNKNDIESGIDENNPDQEAIETSPTVSSDILINDDETEQPI